MSPRHKSHHTPTTSSSSSSSSTPHEPVAPTKEGSKPRKTSTTTTTTTTSTTAAPVIAHRSSIPSLPDVHGKAPSAGLQAGNFLLTLLAEEKLEEEKEEEGVGRLQENGEGRSNAEGSRNSGGSSSRSVVGTKTKGRVTQEGQGHHLNMLERSDKRLPGETLTAKSDKILTASWAGSGDTVDDGRRGQRRRHSRDNGGLSTRRLSGPVPSKRKFRHKLSLSNSPRPQAEFQTGLPSPRAPGQADSTKAVEVLQTSGNLSISPAEEEASGDPARPGFDSAHSPSDSEKCVSGVEPTDLAAVSKKQSGPVQVFPGLEESGRVSKSMPSSPRTTQSLQTEKARYIGKTPSASAEDVAEGRTTVSQITTGSGQVTNTAVTPSLPLTSSTQPSDPFNQWTTCRALDDTDDDDENDDAYDENVDTLGYSKTSEDMQNVVADSPVVDGRFSRAASSNPTRRKRPLLLPPIMLPPVYTVKPTPLVLRDDVYFATTGSRARRPISDEEWDKLWDCRYLRIRTLRRPLKV